MLPLFVAICIIPTVYTLCIEGVNGANVAINGQYNWNEKCEVIDGYYSGCYQKSTNSDIFIKWEDSDYIWELKYEHTVINTQLYNDPREVTLTRTLAFCIETELYDCDGEWYIYNGSQFVDVPYMNHSSNVGCVSSFDSCAGCKGSGVSWQCDIDINIEYVSNDSWWDVYGFIFSISLAPCYLFLLCSYCCCNKIAHQRHKDDDDADENTFSCKAFIKIQFKLIKKTTTLAGASSIFYHEVDLYNNHEICRCDESGSDYFYYIWLITFVITIVPLSFYWYLNALTAQCCTNAEKLLPKILKFLWLLFLESITFGCACVWISYWQFNQSSIGGVIYQVM